MNIMIENIALIKKAEIELNGIMVVAGLKIKGFAKLTGVDQLPVKFDMDKFKDILYHEVHTLGVEDFKKYFYPVLFD